MPPKPPATTRRKPPVPATGHADIAEWLVQATPRLQPIVAHLDALIRKTLSGLQFAVKWKKAYYGLPDHGWLIEMVAYDVSVNLVFFAGAEFDSPPPLGEGARYVKIRSMEDAEAPQIVDWIRQAGTHTGWR